MATAQAGDGTVIYYETWGRGEPLLLICGLATDLRIWACQRLVFGRRVRCIALDNRGSGRSGKPDGPYTLAQMAADAVAVLDAEGVGRAHVLGHSMGSYVAQMMAVEHPDRLLDVHFALERLEILDPGRARLAEMRFFAGLSIEEIAEITGVTSRTVDRQWRAARAWLAREMLGGELATGSSAANQGA